MESPTTPVSKDKLYHPDLMSYDIKDTGSRENFSTGMVRDQRVGKGRYDLIPPEGLRRLAGVYERGAVKYEARNWEKGAPYGRFLDSALRHINTYMENARNGHSQDEDHLAHAVFNLFAIMTFEERKRDDLNDLK